MNTCYQCRRGHDSVLNGSRFSRRVPEKRVASCGMKVCRCCETTWTTLTFQLNTHNARTQIVQTDRCNVYAIYKDPAAGRVDLCNL